MSPGWISAARRAQAVDGATAWAEMAVDDIVHLDRRLGGNDIDDYIRRVLPVWRARHGHLLRGEGAADSRTSRRGTVLLVGNHSGGT